MFFYRDENYNSKVATFDFYDVLDYFAWNLKTNKFELQERDYRDEIDKFKSMDIKTIFNQTGQINNVYNTNENNYYDVSIFGDDSFHSVYSYLNNFDNYINKINAINELVEQNKNKEQLSNQTENENNSISKQDTTKI